MNANYQQISPEALSALRDARSKSFTPGPYKAQQGVEDEPERWTIVADNGTRPYMIAVIENGQPGDTCETEGHTARLLAAAPLMLEEIEIEDTWISNLIADIKAGHALNVTPICENLEARRHALQATMAAAKEV
jgi:hypothetical protein